MVRKSRPINRAHSLRDISLARKLQLSPTQLTFAIAPS
jgi:hypothetical protein